MTPEHFDNLSGHEAEVAAAIAPALEPVVLTVDMAGVLAGLAPATEAVSVTQADVIELPGKVADEPESPKTLSRREIGKMRKLYLTRQLPTVQGCGHKIDPNCEPKLNCQMCWFAWFNAHGELVQTTDELFQEHGGEAVEQLRGRKYLKNFLAFMATLAQWQASQKAAEAAQPNQSNTPKEPVSYDTETSSTRSTAGSSEPADAAA